MFRAAVKVPNREPILPPLKSNDSKRPLRGRGARVVPARRGTRLLLQLPRLTLLLLPLHVLLVLGLPRGIAAAAASLSKRQRAGFTDVGVEPEPPKGIVEQLVPSALPGGGCPPQSLNSPSCKPRLADVVSP